MSEITDTIKRYRDGSMTWDDLLKNLTERDYPDPERMVGRPESVDEKNAFTDNAPHYTEGSYDEVERAGYSGLLTRDEFTKINASVYNYHKAKQDAKGHS